MGRLAGSTSEEARSFLAHFDEFLRSYGSRGPNEWELSADTWETDPSIALAAVDRVRLQGDDASPERRVAGLSADRVALAHDVRRQLAALGDAERAVVLESLRCIKRAGADGILTYYADRVAAWLNE